MKGSGDTAPQKSLGSVKMPDPGPTPILWVPKGWGGEKIVVNTSLYCGKILYIMRGKRCSWHYHELKDECFYIQKGAVEITYGYDDNIEDAKTDILVEGDNFYVPPGLRHQMLALKDTELFEFSTHHEDSDSHRVIAGD